MVLSGGEEGNEKSHPEDSMLVVAGGLTYALLIHLRTFWNL